MLGRQEELALLRAFLAVAAVDGAGLMVSGEPGVGKSALLAVAAEEVESAGGRVLRARGIEFEADLSYSALNQLLVPLQPGVELLSLAHRDALSVALGLGIGPPPDRLVVSTAALMLLRQVAETQPLVVIVDDLQWVDRSSASVLRFVAHRLEGSSVGFLGASRTGDSGFFERSGLAGLDLGPLDDEAAVGLLARRFPSLPPPVRQHLMARARGNPLALLELPVTIRGGPGGAYDLAGASAFVADERLRAYFVSRVSALPATTRRLLLATALLGSGDVAVLRAAGPNADPLAELVAAQRAGLVIVDDDGRRFELRHPLIASAAVEVVPVAERRDVHRSLAELWRDDPQRRAWHLAEASVEPDEHVASLLEAAARSILRRGDAFGAVAAFTRAANLTPGRADRSRRLAAAAYLGTSVTGALDEAAQLLLDARADDPLVGNSLHVAATAVYQLLNGDGDLLTAHRLLAGAIEGHLEQPDSGDDALLDAVDTLFLVCSYGGRPEWWRIFETAMDRRGSRAPEDIAVLAAIHPDPVRATPKALARLDDLIRDLADEPDPVRVSRIGSAAAYVDRLGGCRDALRTLVRLGRDGNAVALAISALNFLSFDAFLAGQWIESRDMSAEGAAMCDEHGYRFLKWPVLYSAALVAAASGEYERAHTLIDEITRWAAPRGVHAALLTAHHAAGLIAMGRRDFDDAYRHASAISAAGTFPAYRPQAMWCLFDLVEAAVHTNRPAEAAAHVAAMTEARVADLSPRLALLAGAAAALAAPGHEAAALFDAALASPDTQRWPFDRARVQLAYGERLRRSKATTAARAHLTAAQDAFTRLGARPWAARAAEELRATGHTRQRSGTTGGAQARLTPQELQIATLAASGLTNKQIAERVFLSHRTVADHLYQIFPKLGISSRAALRDALPAVTDDESANAEHD